MKLGEYNDVPSQRIKSNSLVYSGNNQPIS